VKNLNLKSDVVIVIIIVIIIIMFVFLKTYQSKQISVYFHVLSKCKGIGCVSDK